MRIVIVEDNIGVAKGIAYVLRDAGYAVDLIHDGDDAGDFLRDDGSDVIILDINLPGKNGIEILRDLRARGDARPVLLLTARSEVDQKIAGLDAGADDYLVKPFAMEELTARIRALTRRVGQVISDTKTIGTLTFNLTERQLISPSGPLDLPRREFAIFEALLEAQGRTQSKQTLLDKVYGTGTDIDEQVVEVYVSRLRKKLHPYGVEIKMQRGLGYAMQVAVP